MDHAWNNSRTDSPDFWHLVFGGALHSKDVDVGRKGFAVSWMNPACGSPQSNLRAGRQGLVSNPLIQNDILLNAPGSAMAWCCEHDGMSVLDGFVWAKAMNPAIPLLTGWIRRPAGAPIGRGQPRVLTDRSK
jgi:hypothetical protein